MLKDLLNGLTGILTKDAKEMISAFAMVLIPLGLMWSVMLLPQILTNELEKSEKCWELQSIEEVTYKVNACTGEVLRVQLESKDGHTDEVETDTTVQ